MCITRTTDHIKFRPLGSPERIWAVPAIHGEAERLLGLHDKIFAGFKTGDRIVYLGNYTGYGSEAVACINEILTFRRLLLCLPGVRPSDITYLRGAQEEIWHKLLQLQFAPNPTDVLLWMLGNGLAPTLESYGISPHDGIEACGKGIMAITKWVESIRTAIRRHPGHDLFSAQLIRAAHTDIQSAYPILFVHAGLDTDIPLSDQGDALWWGAHKFEAMDKAYDPFRKVVRGYDPAHRGVNLNCITATIDGGCGFGGALVCAGFDKDGNVFKMLEA